MDNSTNPVLSPFSGDTNPPNPPPPAEPSAPPTATEPPVTQPLPDEPSWHAPDLPKESLPAVPPPEASEEALPAPSVLPSEPAAPLPSEGPSFPPSPPAAEPETVAPPKKKSSAGKAIVFTLIFFILAVGGVLGYVTVQQGGLPFSIFKKAQEWTCGPEHGVCNGHTVSWSTCDSTGRWGCDDCHRNDLPADWCEGTTHKHCSGGTVTSETNDPDCGGGDGGDGPCADHQGEDVCESNGDRNGSVSVRNCFTETRVYQCQKNHRRFDSTSSCQSATRTDDYTGISGMSVAPGQTGTCSVDPGGTCDISQADIRYNNSTICWDTSKNCTNCGVPTLTPTPTVGVTPTAGVTVIPVLLCESLTVTKVTPGGESADLSNLKARDQINIKLQATQDPGISIVDLAIRIVRISNGERRVEDRLAGESRRSWTYTYTLPEAGDYEISGFVKIVAHSL